MMNQESNGIDAALTAVCDGEFVISLTAADAA